MIEVHWIWSRMYWCVLMRVVTVGNEDGNSKLIHNFHTYTQMCRSLYSKKSRISCRVSLTGPKFLTFHSTALDFRQAIFKWYYQLLAWALQYIGCNLKVTWGYSQTLCFCLLCMLREFCGGFLTFLFYVYAFTRILFRSEIFHVTLRKYSHTSILHSLIR
jgi:hypothetical protein